MPNQLSFSINGQPQELYRSLSHDTRASLDVVLDLLLVNPSPDGIHKTAIFMSPVVVYYYEDEDWKVSYSLSYYPVEKITDIGIYAIAQK